MKKRFGLRWKVCVALVILLSVMLMGCSGNSERRLVAQLEELDATSLEDLLEWLEAEGQESDFRILIANEDTEGNVLHRGGVYIDHSRFMEWSYEIDGERERLYLDLLFEHFDFEGYILGQLESLDRTSRAGIDDWIRANEDNSDINIVTEFVDTNGNDLDAEWWDRRAGFVEWRLDFGESRHTVSVTYLFDMAKANDPYTFWVGEAFEHGGFRLTVHDHIEWGIIDGSPYSGKEYFRVGITVENISAENTLTPIFLRDGPNGEQLPLLGTVNIIDISMRPIQEGEVKEGFIYFLYVGSGDYVMAIMSMEDPDAGFIEGYITVDSENR